MVSPIGRGYDTGVSGEERKREREKRGGEYIGEGCGEIDEENWRG